MYGLQVRVYRAMGLDDEAMLIVPILIFLVFSVMITATTVYSIRTSENKIKFFDIAFFLLTSAVVAPLLLIPTIRGILRKNKLKPNKKEQWNRRIKLYRISTIYTFMGLAFGTITGYTILDLAGIVNWYPHQNYFFILFLLISFMLLFSLPFVAFMKWKFKESPLFQDENVYI
jgi:MFS family permease